jgi:hypothetical protein
VSIKSLNWLSSAAEIVALGATVPAGEACSVSDAVDGADFDITAECPRKDRSANNDRKYDAPQSTGAPRMDTSIP